MIIDFASKKKPNVPQTYGKANITFDIVENPAVQFHQKYRSLTIFQHLFDFLGDVKVVSLIMNLDDISP